MTVLLAALAVLGGHPAVKPRRVVRCRTAACGHRLARRRWAHRPMRTAVASVFGPGDQGGPLACGGGNLTDATLGVASKTLPCGTRLMFCARRCVIAPVVDRGPYVAGREFDLSTGLARAIGFTAGVGEIRVSR